MRFLQAEHYYATNRPRWIVIHDMEYPKASGAAEWCARYFAGPNAPMKSAHYCIDPTEIIQSVREDNGAWHTQGFIHTNEGALEINRASIGIDMPGTRTRTALNGSIRQAPPSSSSPRASSPRSRSATRSPRAISASTKSEEESQGSRGTSISTAPQEQEITPIQDRAFRGTGT